MELWDFKQIAGKNQSSRVGTNCQSKYRKFNTILRFDQVENRAHFLWALYKWAQQDWLERSFLSVKTRTFYLVGKLRSKGQGRFSKNSPSGGAQETLILGLESAKKCQDDENSEFNSFFQRAFWLKKLTNFCQDIKIRSRLAITCQRGISNKAR